MIGTGGGQERIEALLSIRWDGKAAYSNPASLIVAASPRVQHTSISAKSPSQPLSLKRNYRFIHESHVTEQTQILMLEPRILSNSDKRD